MWLGLQWNIFSGLVKRNFFLSFSKFSFRFAGSPEKIVFMKDAMNVIDVLSIFPFFLDLFVLGGAVEE